ncbi:MAG: 3-oxoacyl-[acyl-carrier-protein] reductase [Anaerolineae bacterium]
MQIDLTERVALVTGSAHRVGKAIALALAQRGANILVHYNSTDENTVRGTLHEIKSHGVDAFAVQANISTPEGVKILFDAVRHHYGKLDILVNSASTFTGNTFMQVTLEDWEKSMDTNLKAPFLCTQAAVPLMQQNVPPGGVVINICDYGSVNPWPARVDHGISKAGLAMLTKVAAISLGEHNIRVNAVLPGPVLKAPGTSDEAWRRIGERVPLGRTGDEADVARAVAFLVGEDFITGEILHVNGGEHLRML